MKRGDGETKQENIMEKKLVVIWRRKENKLKKKGNSNLNNENVPLGFKT